MVVFYDPNRRPPPRTVEEYSAAHHAVLDFGGQGLSTVDVALKELGLTRRVVIGVPNASALGAVVRGTDMICTMQKSLGAFAFEGLSYCKPPISFGPVQFDLVWHRRQAGDPMSHWMRELALRVMLHLT